MEQNHASGKAPGPIPGPSLRSAQGHIAPLANIGIMEQALSRLAARRVGDPGMIVVSGPSGYGKSVAAAWAKARHRAYYVQLDDFINKKTLLITLCRALGLESAGNPVRGTTAELADLVGAQLAGSGRPLILDEFDFAVDKGLVMSVFSIYEKSRASIVLIGEEALPGKLKRWEKFDGRVLDTFYAEAVGVDDARTLAEHQYEAGRFAEEAIEYLVEIAGGSVRRVNNNLAMGHEEALKVGLETIPREFLERLPLQLPGVKRRAR